MSSGLHVWSSMCVIQEEMSRNRLDVQIDWKLEDKGQY